MEHLKRCKICHLPETYPGLSIDEEGVCRLCKQTAEEKPYLGEAALREKVSRLLAHSAPSRPYDAAVAFSGGRDSSYLLHYVKHELGLSVLAVTLTHDFMPQETVDAIQRICTSLQVDLHIIPNQALNQCSSACVQAWARKPEPASLVSFCTGCRYGIKRLIPEYCRQQGIPLLFVGNTRMEQMSYRQDLLALDQQHPTALSKAAGYLKTVLKNPALLSSPRCACVQAYEFAYPLARKLLRDKQLHVLAPFRDHLEVQPEIRNAALNAMGWGHNAAFKSQWRADCYVNILRQYFYQRLLGFNDLDVHYAQLLRRGEIDLPTALNNLQAENQFDPSVIAQILEQHYQLDLSDLQTRFPTKTE